VTRIALVDADELAYKHSLRYQNKYYTLLKDDKVLWRVRYKEEAIESVGNRDDLEIGEEIEILECKGFEDALDKDISRILYNSNASDVRFYLSGSQNFRYNLATLQPYKGNRPPEKPYHLETLQTEFRYRAAESIEFLEADDLLSANSTILNGEGVICSSDKDLRTVPGLNYNIGTGKLTHISIEEARHNFYYQMLIGDDTDNIPSPYGLGEVKAKEFLKVLYGKEDKEYYRQMVPFYAKFLHAKDKQGKYKTKWFKGDELYDILWEVGNLLWMHRTLSPEERWEIPHG
jgi:DNA polymerase-1